MTRRPLILPEAADDKPKEIGGPIKTKPRNWSKMFIALVPWDLYTTDSAARFLRDAEIITAPEETACKLAVSRLNIAPVHSTSTWWGYQLHGFTNPQEALAHYRTWLAELVPHASHCTTSQTQEEAATSLANVLKRKGVQHNTCAMAQLLRFLVPLLNEDGAIQQAYNQYSRIDQGVPIHVDISAEESTLTWQDGLKTKHPTPLVVAAMNTGDLWILSTHLKL